MFTRIERAPLLEQFIAIHAFGQAVDVGARNTTLREVILPPIDHSDHTSHLSGHLKPRIAKQFALRHRIGKGGIPLIDPHHKLLKPLP